MSFRRIIYIHTGTLVSNIKNYSKYNKYCNPTATIKKKLSEVEGDIFWWTAAEKLYYVLFRTIIIECLLLHTTLGFGVLVS